MDWPELIEAFFAAKQHTFASNIRRAYHSDLVACARLLPAIPLVEITVAHLRLFLDATANLATTTLACQVAYGQLGILTDRDLNSRLNRATCLSLLLNVIAAWNVRYMQAALDHLSATGDAVLESDLEHLSPIFSGHINLHGSHHFDMKAPKKRQGQLRPLRTAVPLF